jgi:lipoprotein-releasing system ATP-binding protein
MSNVRPVIEAHGVRRSYTDNGRTLPILNGVDLEVMPGEFVAIVGASGSGKSTLLHCLGGLDSFDAGTIKIDGEDLASLSEKERTQLRNRKLGFVYQFHHLLAEFTAEENVSMPLRIRREAPRSFAGKVREVLEHMGLGDRAEHLPSQLSGGERQRVAIARAVVSDPVCLLADEPTGNLDHETAKTVIDYLMRLAREKKVAVVIVTHDLFIASRCDRILRLVNGRIEPQEAASD